MLLQTFSKISKQRKSSWLHGFKVCSCSPQGSGGWMQCEFYFQNAGMDCPALLFVQDFWWYNKHALGLICVLLFVCLFVVGSNLNLISKFCRLISLSPFLRSVSPFSAPLFKFLQLFSCLHLSVILYLSSPLTAETSSPSFQHLWLSATLYPVASPSHSFSCPCSSPEAPALFQPHLGSGPEIFSCGPRLSFFLSSFPGPTLVWFVSWWDGLCAVWLQTHDVRNMHLCGPGLEI